jgi:hypothetical protein
MTTSSSNIIDTHTWNHVCFTYNKYNSNVSLFVNNQLVSTNNIDFNIKDIVSDVDFNIGYNHTLGSNNYFEGTIDEIVLYNTVLDKQHIEYISNPNNSLQFLKNNVNRISTNPITKTLNVIDMSDSNVSPTIVGDVVISSDITFGLKSMKFTGHSHISIQNDGIDPKLFSIGTWVNPTDNINQTFIKKEGVFELGTNEFGNIRFDINDIPSDQLKYVKNTMNKYYKKIHPPIYNDTLSWWMDASDLSTIEKDDNGYVTSWTSKGSFMLGLDTYANTKKIPVSHNTVANHVTHNEELGYMLFNDTAYFQYFDSDFFYDTSFTCFIKYSMDTLDNTQCIFGNDAGGSVASTAYAILRQNNTGTKNWDGLNSSTTISVDDDTNVHTYVIRYDNDGTIGKSSIDSKTIWFDGEVKINTGTYRADLTGSTRTNQMKGTIGLAHGNNTVHSNILNGKIFSILWYNSVLTDVEVGQTLDYINEKVPTNLDELNTSHFEFNDSMTDSKNPDFVAQGENLSFKKSFNQIAHKCVELNEGSSINLGKVFENVTNTNQMTISTWVNLKDLQGNQPLMSVFGGFEWWINKYDGPENSELNSVINFYIPNKPKSFVFTNVSLNVNVYDIDFTIDTTIDTQYYMVAFVSKQELNSSLIVQFASLQGDIKGSVTGTLENISTFVEHVFNNDGTIYDITSVNEFFIYIFVKGGELNENIVIESYYGSILVDTNPVISYKYAILNLDTNVIDINTSVYNAHYDLLDCYIGVFHPDFDINSISESDLVNNLLINQSTLSTGLYKVSNKTKSNVHTLYNQFTHALIYTDGIFTTAPIGGDLQYNISTILRFNDILVIDTHTSELLIKDQHDMVALQPSIISSVSKDEINKTLTINAQIFSTYANITSIKLVVVDGELEVTEADISTMNSIMELPTLNMNHVFNLNETISTYYTDLSGTVATITDVDEVKYFIYVVDNNDNVLIYASKYYKDYIMGNTPTTIRDDIIFVDKNSEILTETTSDYNISTYITLKTQNKGVSIHNEPIDMTKSFSIIYWAYAPGTMRQVSAYITEHASFPVLNYHAIRYLPNSISLYYQEGSHGNNQNFESFQTTTSDGTYLQNPDTVSDGRLGSVNYKQRQKVGIVYDSSTQILTRYIFNSSNTLLHTHYYSNIVYTSKAGFIKFYIIYNGWTNTSAIYEIDGLHIFRRDALTSGAIGILTSNK